MRLLLTRRRFTDRSTIGELFVDGNYACDTLEDQVRADPNLATPANEGKVYGETAIPALAYELALVKPHRAIWSPRGDGKLLKVLWRDAAGALGEVPGFTGIYLHAFNRPEESLGCIAPGRRTRGAPDWVGGSRVELAALMLRVDPALAAGEVVELVIEERRDEFSA